MAEFFESISVLFEYIMLFFGMITRYVKLGFNSFVYVSQTMQFLPAYILVPITIFFAIVVVNFIIGIFRG